MQTKRSAWRRLAAGALVVLVVIFLVLQFIPLDMSNPSVVQEPNWDSPRTRELAQAACFDCHSNETVWPWYAKIAPARLLLWNDVREGRETLNFSDWQHSEIEIGEIAEVIDEGEMPPWYYTLMHGEADLSAQEKQDLINGLRATFSGVTLNNG